MKHLILILFLSGCTYPPKAPEAQTFAPLPVKVMVIKQIIPEKSAIIKKNANLERPCIDLDKENLLESIRLKLDCIDKEL